MLIARSYFFLLIMEYILDYIQTQYLTGAGVSYSGDPNKLIIVHLPLCRPTALSYQSQRLDVENQNQLTPALKSIR